MKLKSLILGLLTTTVTLVGVAANYPKANAQVNNRVRFICGQSYDQETNRRLPTTIAVTSAGRKNIIQWESKNIQGYSPQRRCQEVSGRFQEAYQKRMLNFLTTSQVNNQPVICIARRYQDGCQMLLMTLLPGEDTLRVANDLRNALNGRQVGPVRHSSEVPSVYYEINIDELLRNVPIIQN